MARVRHALPALEALQLGYNRLEGAPTSLSSVTWVEGAGLGFLTSVEAGVARVYYALPALEPLQLGYDRLEGAVSGHITSSQLCHTLLCTLKLVQLGGQWPD